MSGTSKSHKKRRIEMLMQKNQISKAATIIEGSLNEANEEVSMEAKKQIIQDLHPEFRHLKLNSLQGEMMNEPHWHLLWMLNPVLWATTLRLGQEGVMSMTKCPNTKCQHQSCTPIIHGSEVNRRTI